MSFNVPPIHVTSGDTTQLPTVQLLPTSVEKARASGHFPLSKEVTNYCTDTAQYRSAEDFYKWSVKASDSTLEWAIHTEETNTYIGSIGIWYTENDVDRCSPMTTLFITHPGSEFRGRRYGLAANLGLAAYMFGRAGAEVLQAGIEPQNRPSVKMHEKMGYLSIGYLSMPEESRIAYRYILPNPSRPALSFGNILDIIPDKIQDDAMERYSRLASLIEISIE